MTTHPDKPHGTILEDTNIIKTSVFLDNRKIAIVCGGGIAATEVPRLARELRRHGAITQIYMTENALQFIGLESMRWASQNEVILKPSGLSEHICTADAVVVVPATADLISKVCHGICSDASTTLIQSALGLQKPIIFCQTMHDSLANSSIIMDNKNSLKKLPAVQFIEPRKEEGKQKIPPIETLALNICHLLNQYQNNNIEHLLVTLGGTRVMLDPVRCITNLSTGSLGNEVVKLFYGFGYKITVLAGLTSDKLDKFPNVIYNNLPNYDEMYEFCNSINPSNYSGLIHLVAASDFAPSQAEKNKINSANETYNFILNKTKKLFETKIKWIPFKAAAKLTQGNKEEGLRNAEALLKRENLNAVFWSTANSAWHDRKSHSGIFLGLHEEQIQQEIVDGKKQIAHCYFNAFENYKKISHK